MKIITSTAVKVKTIKAGVASYTVSASRFIGTQIFNENGQEIKRVKIGPPVDLYTTDDVRSATAFIKRLKRAGNVVHYTP